MCSNTLQKQENALHVSDNDVSSSTLTRRATDVSSVSSAWSESTEEETTQPSIRVDGQNDSTTRSSIQSFILLLLMSIGTLEFSLWLPFVIPGVSEAAILTYIPAAYQYDHNHSRFDNTAWTYNTDYFLTAVMLILTFYCLKAHVTKNDPVTSFRKTQRLQWYSASLLTCYAVSTFAGGWAHQHFTSLEQLNTLSFRLFWIVCVGNVSFASCYMGLIGREVQQIFGVEGMLPLGPWWFWPGYGLYMAGTCALGYISFKRPACDIFIAGITQFPTTFYCLLALGLRKWPTKNDIRNGKTSTNNKAPIDLVRLPFRCMFYIGFIGNAPLLPMYPLLVQYTNMSLAQINTLLHTWLMVTWGMQGISLIHLCGAISQASVLNDRMKEK